MQLLCLTYERIYVKLLLRVARLLINGEVAIVLVHVVEVLDLDHVASLRLLHLVVVLL